jgi:hypothetical protein
MSTGEHRKLSDTQIDIIAGIGAGLVSIMVTHPIDTIKVRYQLKTSGATIKNITADIY